MAASIRSQGAASQGPQGAGEAGTHQAGCRVAAAAEPWSSVGGAVSLVSLVVVREEMVR